MEINDDEPAEATSEPVEAVEGEAPSETAETPDAAPDAHPRGPDGKFVTKQPGAEAEPEPALPGATPTPEPVQPVIADIPAPRSFADPIAKSAWGKTPPEVRAEVERRFGELERGLAEYQQRIEPLKAYDEYARKNGTTLAAYLENVSGIERAIMQDPVKGMDALCRAMGLDFRQLAAHVAGQPAPERDVVIDGLRSELAQIKQQVGGVQQTFQQQQEKSIAEMVTTFAAANPRFQEPAVADEIAKQIQAGFDLEAAYKRACLLVPGIPIQTAPQTSPVPPAAPAPQTSKAAIAITGAPSLGSDPNPAHRAKNSQEALERAFSRVGLR
jgi:hypothetical protein